MVKKKWAVRPSNVSKAMVFGLEDADSDASSDSDFHLDPIESFKNSPDSAVKSFAEPEALPGSLDSVENNTVLPQGADGMAQRAPLSNEPRRIPQSASSSKQMAMLIMAVFTGVCIGIALTVVIEIFAGFNDCSCDPCHGDSAASFVEGIAGPPPPPPPSAPPPASRLHFLVAADTGGIDDPPYTTLEQLTVAQQMGVVAERTGSEFTLLLGDNFYDNGIFSSVPENELTLARLNNTFESIYTHPALLTHFYVLAGNHDHYGDVTAQIAYTGLSDYWEFPDLWYTFTYSVPDQHTTVQVLMIDTQVAQKDWRMMRLGVFAKRDYTYLYDSQMKWIISTLEESDADWVLVAGHHPVWSVSQHGPTEELVEELIPLFEAHGVALYMNGHDHNMQHHRGTDGTSVAYLTLGNGGGSKIYAGTRHAEDVPEGSLRYYFYDNGGFMHVQVHNSSMLTFNFINQTGELLYTYDHLNPRSMER
ncbi:hypothetical protein CYMTET_20983 [Cymbomonas tetramitiformis]|uniref:acid phosphatase n=1 Tax=Cymbomonas tetramitiformis TaxID=36881 RepID=A0AAE0G2X4_9CHLO|nr:hypothetical protein CYMTET_20983 [Cymbomonas tetramitiformis]